MITHDSLDLNLIGNYLSHMPKPIVSDGKPMNIHISDQQQTLITGCSHICSQLPITNEHPANSLIVPAMKQTMVGGLTLCADSDQ
jgi:hypothetical protein